VATSTNYWQGKLIRLRAAEAADWEKHYEWNQDTEMYRSLDRIHFPNSKETTKQRWLEIVTKEARGDDFFFEIENLAGEYAGEIDTDGCDRRNGIVSYGIAVRREHQRKGYASEAITMVLRYYFQELRYQKANASAYSFNQASIRLHEKLGFIQEGRRRRAIFTGGQYHDLIMFGMTSDEFNARFSAN
jgi:RimJ/RimL family protein N-acetyltransferase